MHDHTPSGHDRHRWTLRSAIHVLGAIGDFWSSDLNRAAVDLINPQPAETLLDVGAGLGPATIEAARRLGRDGRVIAVDPSPSMRRILRLRRLWQRTRRVIDIRVGSAEHLPVETDSVDAAFSINAAHHFDDNELATAELTRVLKPGGRLLLIDEDLTNPDHPYDQHHHDTEKPEPVDASNIVKLLTTNGITATQTDHYAIAGITATIINATAPSDRATSHGDENHQLPRGHS